jgi:hypothetical protein
MRVRPPTAMTSRTTHAVVAARMNVCLQCRHMTRTTLQKQHSYFKGKVVAGQVTVCGGSEGTASLILNNDTIWM